MEKTFWVAVPLTVLSTIAGAAIGLQAVDVMMEYMPELIGAVGGPAAGITTAITKGAMGAGLVFSVAWAVG